MAMYESQKNTYEWRILSLKNLRALSHAIDGIWCKEETKIQTHLHSQFFSFRQQRILQKPTKVAEYVVIVSASLKAEPAIYGIVELFSFIEAQLIRRS